MAKVTKAQEVAREEQYVAFLEKRLASKNYQANVSPDEYAQTKEKLKKARFRLKILRGK